MPAVAAGGFARWRALPIVTGLRQLFLYFVRLQATHALLRGKQRHLMSPWRCYVVERRIHTPTISHVVPCISAVAAECST
jgi:hypothetical protein